MKIFWGIDPFHQNKTQLQRAYKLILAMQAKPKDEIHVGYVVTRNETDLTLAFDVPIDERFTSYPKKVLEKKLKNAGIPTQKLRLHVVDFPTLSTTKAAEYLLKMAKQNSCDLCVVYSQGGSSVKKLFLGSFAESIVHLAQNKLLVVNPHSKLQSGIKSVFFCYDGERGSQKALEDTIVFCKEKGARLIVFHAARFSYNIADKNLSSDEKAYNQKLNQTKKSVEDACAKQKVICKFIISTKFEMISTLALKHASKQRADLVAVVAKSGRGTALMGGSVTRQILRASRVPVLVLR
jgi:nucleotide-binding universal stress UspA family protein